MVITRRKAYESNSSNKNVRKMNVTPNSKKSSLSYKLRTDKHDNVTLEEQADRDNIKTSTQSRLSVRRENDCSPIYLPCTQEAFDQLDVVWDWNSPQSKRKQKLQKRTQKCQSPKLPIKKCLSNNQIESYDKLKKELEALKNQLVESRKCENNSKALLNDKVDEVAKELTDLDDIFGDDSLEEEMILQSQKIEELINMEIKNDACDISNNPLITSNVKNTSVKCDLRKVKSENYISGSSIDYINVNKKRNSNSEIDLFDFTLESIEDRVEFQEPANYKQILNKSHEELETNRTCNHQEIEQKRLQALEKLKSKKYLGIPSKNDGPNRESMEQISQSRKNIEQTSLNKEEDSPIKYSPEEIEQKRLQAVAKLEQKKKEDKIERNRKEALKRLEINKKKRAMALQYFCNKN